MFSPPLSCFASISPPLFFFTPLPFKIAHNGVVPPTLRTTVLNLYWQTFVLIFGFVVSFVCLCLVSIWEYRLDNLRVFSVSQLQAWECFQVLADSICFLLFCTQFLQ